MWVRRDPKEVLAITRRNRRRRLSPLGPFLLALLFTVFAILVPRSPRPTFSWPPAVFTFGIAFTLLYLSHATTGRYLPIGITRFNPSPGVRDRMICPGRRTAQFDTLSH